jgi:hypothetical protein
MRIFKMNALLTIRAVIVALLRLLRVAEKI